MDDGTLVGGYRVGALLKGSFEMIDGGLAVVGVEGAGFEDDVGADAFEPLADVSRSCSWVLRGPVIVEDSERVQAVGVGEPARAAGGYAGEAPADVVAAAEFGLFGDEQAQEGAADVAETYQGQVVGWNGFLPGNEFMTRMCPLFDAFFRG